MKLTLPPAFCTGQWRDNWPGAVQAGRSKPAWRYCCHGCRQSPKAANLSSWHLQSEFGVHVVLASQLFPQANLFHSDLL